MNRLGTFQLHLAAIFFALMSTQCTLAVDEAGTEAITHPGETGQQEQALANGTVSSNENHTGIVAIQVWSSQLNSYATICTGTLMRNNKVLTAAHCLWGYVDRPMYVRMGGQRVGVSLRVPSTTVDAAILKLTTPLFMWNWSNTRFLTSPPQVTSSGYSRAIYPDTNASLNGKQLLCWGHGGANWTTGPYEPSLKYGGLTAEYPYGTWRDINFGQLVVHLAGNVGLQEGDSGGPCLDNISTIGSRVAVIMTAAFNFGVGAADWRSWVQTTLSSI